jgi:methylmalonyl-CoA mutase cobalamin-binding subunit
VGMVVQPLPQFIETRLGLDGWSPAISAGLQAEEKLAQCAVISSFYGASKTDKPRFLNVCHGAGHSAGAAAAGAKATGREIYCNSL